MELALNLVWLGLACSLAIAYALRCARMHRTSEWSRRQFLTGLVAVAVLAAIALPVISLTDDLQAMSQVAESDQAFRPISHDSAIVGVVHSAVASLDLLQGPPKTFAGRLPKVWNAPPARNQVERPPAEQRPPPSA